MKSRFFLLSVLAFGLCVPKQALCSEFPAQDAPEEILQAFMLKRLEKAVVLITQLDQRGIFPKLCAHMGGLTCTIFNEETPFTYEDINRCKELIETNKSLQPFITLWANMQNGQTKVTLTYLKEVAILILKIYKTIYTACSPLLQTTEQPTKSLTIDTIALLFGNIASLQAFELLSIIEKLTIQIPKLLEKYEITTGTLTWKEWIIKYWWLPPMAIAAIVLECAFIYQVAVGAKKLPTFFKNNKETISNT